MRFIFLIFAIVAETFGAQKCSIYQNTTALFRAGVPFNDNTVIAILDYVKDQDENLKLDSETDAVLILGATGSGKSTLSMLLTGGELNAKRIESVDGGFQIVDKNDKINEISSKSPKTIVPDLMIDEINGTAFYDCPSFSDSKKVHIDIASTFTFRKLLNFAKSFKFIFTITYNSMHAVDGRSKFLELVQFATTTIKNVKKYRGAIALIVTKVPGHFNDTAAMESIVTFLKQMKTELHNQLLENQLLFIDILLERKHKRFSRIGYLRSPIEEGPLNIMSSIQEDKAAIFKIINENIYYVRKEAVDFGFSLSQKSTNRLNDIINELKSQFIADFIGINAEIKRFLINKEKQHSHNLNESIDNAMFIFQKLSQINSTQPQIFTSQFVDTIDGLGISILSGNFKKSLQHMEILDFLQVFSSKHFTIPIEILNELTISRAYLSNSQAWYGFLVDLGEKLSEYSIQKRAATIDGSKLMNLAINVENAEVLVSDMDIKSTIYLIEPSGWFYTSIQHLFVNTFKLNLLQAVWSQSMQNISEQCSSNGTHLEVKGYNMLMSDVIQLDCWRTARHIQVFALNKVFLDTDIDGQVNKSLSRDIAIASPIWEVITNKTITSRIFNLNGQDGRATRLARNSTEYPFDSRIPREKLEHPFRGENGAPGYFGGSAGQFFAIGQRINNQRVKIYINGGRGGNGQNGGNGLDGLNGHEPPNSTNVEFLSEHLGFCSTITEYRKRLEHIVYHTFHGLSGFRGTDGGHGGCGAPGGLKGKSLIFGFDNSTYFDVFNEDGEKGTSGKGGKGGNAAANGRNMTVAIKYRNFIIFEKERGRSASYGNGSSQPAGIDGKDAEQCNDLSPQKLEFSDPLRTFNSYKYYLREHLANNIRVSNVDNCLNHLNYNSELNALYNTKDLITEFESIEDQYVKLRKNLSFIPFYEALSERIVNFSRTVVDKIDDKKALNFLYTAVSSRLFAMKSHANHIAVINLLEYMKIVQKRMKKLQQTQKTEYINEYRDEYKNTLDNKIETAGNLVQKTVIPRINSTFQETDERIKELINEMVEKRNQTDIEIQKAKENKETLKTKILLRTVMSPLRFVGASLSLFGPPGMIAGAAVGTGAAITDAVIESTLTLHKVTVPVGSIREEVLRISKQAKHNFELLEMQLNDLYEVLKNENSTELEPIERDMDAIMKDIKIALENVEIPYYDQVKQLKEARDKLARAIDNITKDLKDRVNPGRGIESVLKALDFMKSIVTVGEAGLEIYGQIRNDTIKIMEVNEILGKLDEQMRVLKHHEMNIYSIMIPQLKIVEQTVKFAINNSMGKMHVELDISRWSIQSALNDVKNLFNQMSKGFLVSSDLERCIEKINEGITTIIDVYDRIDSYTEKAQLATLIADIAVGQNDIKDRGLRESVFRIETIINANLVIEQYEMAMLALKQHKFPFAERFLDQFDLPSNISTSDSQLTSKTVNRISELVLKIKESKSLIEEIDAFTFSNYTFIDDESFYRWDYDNYKNEIIDLFNGGNVRLVADIDDGLSMSAVKFNEIWIKFKFKNTTEQEDFDSVISEFSIMLQMIGNSYYRCDKRFYYIPLEKSVSIAFTLQDGEPTKPNEIYSKLKTGDYFLSPYTTWKLSLTPKNNNNNEFRKLRPFAKKISEISLEGRGQYLENKKWFIYKICNDELDRFYRFDKIEHTRIA